MSLQEVGVVRAIYRYPVKSMAGEAVPEAALGWHGLADDRRYAFRRVGQVSAFPWLTASKLPSLILYRPCHADPDMRVITPDGQEIDLYDEALRQHIAAAHGADVRIARLNRGIYDEAKLSLISTATIAAIASQAGAPLDVRRFRPNLLIEPTVEQPFVEDEWVGQLLVFGQAVASPAMRVTMRDLRCVMINLDPDTAVSDPRVLKATARLNETCAGVYGTAFRTGTIRAGDRVYLVRS